LKDLLPTCGSESEVYTMRQVYLAFLVMIGGLALVSCMASTPAVTPTPTPPPTATAQPTATPGLPPGDFFLMDHGSNLAFKATLRGQGDLVVVMANQGNNDTYSWDGLARKLVEKGFVAVNFTYTVPDMGIASTELDQVIDYLVQKGKYQHIVCIGGSMGGTACGTVAQRPEIVGIALLAGGDSPDLSGAKYPKLFVTGENDTCCAGFMKTAYDEAAAPKTLKIFPGTGAHAVGLFSSEYGDELTNLLVDFVQHIR
jgi:hypothetical protein